MRVFWWKGPKYPNLGDELGATVTERLLEVEVQHSPLSGADLVTAGSSLGWSFKWDRSKIAPEYLHVIGSGFMSPDFEAKQRPHLRIHSVRGFLSKNRLGGEDNTDITVGDPGLLVPRVVRPAITDAPAPTKYGIVLHHSVADNNAVKSKFEHLPAKFIDIRTTDLDGFVRDLLTCDVIIGQSLHALVLADALGIPNVWINLGALHAGSNFKFYDYFSSVGREFYKGLTEVPSEQRLIDEEVFQSNKLRVYKLQRDIEQAYQGAISEMAMDGTM